MEWLNSYKEAAALTDKFKGRDDHLLLLTAGLLGETGSILTEIKKVEREGNSYPVYRERLTEELGDFLWYYVRLVTLCEPTVIDNFSTEYSPIKASKAGSGHSLDLGSAVGQVLQLVQKKEHASQLKTALETVWTKLVNVAGAAEIDLEEAGQKNLGKTQSRWPAQENFHNLFDEFYSEEEQLPRTLTVQFIERIRGNRTEVLVRCNGVTIGDRITDNIQNPDDYRYHDIFHLAHAVFLGWSPVTRALLHCKRKSNPAVDENQDGARAIIIEEAASAIIFSRAKQMQFFEKVKQVDYDLLKNIQGFIRGYEVDQVPLWQWEKAIIEGYRVFRFLRSNQGGKVTWDLHRRTLEWSAG